MYNAGFGHLPDSRVLLHEQRLRLLRLNSHRGPGRRRRFGQRAVHQRPVGRTAAADLVVVQQSGRRFGRLRERHVLLPRRGRLRRRCVLSPGGGRHVMVVHVVVLMVTGGPVVVVMPLFHVHGHGVRGQVQLLGRRMVMVLLVMMAPVVSARLVDHHRGRLLQSVFRHGGRLVPDRLLLAADRLLVLVLLVMLQALKPVLLITYDHQQ